MYDRMIMWTAVAQHRDALDHHRFQIASFGWAFANRTRHILTFRPFIPNLGLLEDAIVMYQLALLVQGDLSVRQCIVNDVINILSLKAFA